ncbi:MAG TPA: hypothetical protein VGI99_07795 [Gemmataceae bacterium]
MSPLALRRMAALVVLGLLVTSFPARVGLFGACPVCGQFHEKVLVVRLGDAPTDSAPDDSPGQDDSRAADGCFPPLPYCATASGMPVAVNYESGDSLRVQSDSQIASIPASTLIRPPRV